MKIAICDDELIFAQKLSEAMRSYTQQRELEVELLMFTNWKDLVAAKVEHFDALFLDVQLGDTTGIEIAHEMQTNGATALIIFISSHVEYAPRAFEVRTFRYLLKEDFDNSFNTCMDAVVLKLQQQMRDIAFKTTEGAYTRLLLSDITYIESMNHNLIIHTSKGEYKTYEKLNQLESILIKKDFIRVQRSYLVNMRTALNVTSKKVTLRDGTELPVGRQSAQIAINTFLKLQGED